MKFNLKKCLVSLMVIVTLVGVTPAKAYVDNYRISGGKWSYGVGTILCLWYRQESKYYHPTKKHYANAMMNGNYAGRTYATKGKWANAFTKYHFGGWKTNKSYYGF